MEILMKKKNKWDEKYNQNNISQFYFEVTNFYTRNIPNHNILFYEIFLKIEIML